MWKAMEFVSIDDFIAALDSGEYQIWSLAPDCWMLCEFVNTIEGRTLNILTIVGVREYWQQGVESIEKIARMNDASFIYSIGFPGWKKFLEKNGYKTRPMLQMTKVLK